jgi:uncharacterized protein YlzI (FlbEa/FlbD family)
MILLTLKNGEQEFINHEKMKKIKPLADTVIVMDDDNSILVKESATEVVKKIKEFKASVLQISK